MIITEAIAAEHETFLLLFDQIERVLPSVKSRAQVTAMAAVVEGLLGNHAQMETDLAFAVLDHALLHKHKLRRMHREHHEMDARLHQVQRAGTCAQARRLLRAALRASVRHFRSEERSVLPALERALKSEHLAALGQAFTRIRRGKAKPGGLAGRGRATLAQERAQLRDPSHPKPDPSPPSAGTGPDCRARKIGRIERFAGCLVKEERDCEYTLELGGRRLCYHPQRDLIIARTRAAAKSSGGRSRTRHSKGTKVKGAEQTRPGL